MNVGFTSLVLLSLTSSALAFEWKECGKGQTHISSVSLTPDPPVAGSPANFGIKGESGMHAVSLSFRCITVFCTGSLTSVCLQESRWMKAQCPLLWPSWGSPSGAKHLTSATERHAL